MVPAAAIRCGAAAVDTPVRMGIYLYCSSIRLNSAPSSRSL